MNYLKRLAVLLNVITVAFITTTVILYAWTDVYTVEDANNFFYAIKADETLSLIIGSVCLFLILSNYIFYRLFSVGTRKNKIIAFDNPSGRVSVSLLAMEDLIRRLVVNEPEVKDAKIKIVAVRKGLQVQIKLIIKKETVIPETTSKIQELVLKKIQNTIGVEEKVNISVFVSKILPESIKGAKKDVKKEKQDKKGDPQVPFQGYRA